MVLSTTTYQIPMIAVGGITKVALKRKKVTFDIENLEFINFNKLILNQKYSLKKGGLLSEEVWLTPEIVEVHLDTKESKLSLKFNRAIPFFEFCKLKFKLSSK